MITIKKETVSQLVSVIKSLESKVVSLEERVNSSQQDYSQLLEILKPLLQDLQDSSEGHKQARGNQMMSSHIMVLLKATGFIKSAYETYGKHDSEIARVLELITGYSNENFRKALSAGEINISAIDRGSADSEKKQMIDHLKQIGCKVTADKVNDLW
jgi:hypothetical protein